MAKRQSSLEGAKRAPRTGRAADFTRQGVSATRARRLSASQVATATLLGQFVEAVDGLETAWRHEPAGGAAFLATCANRALLGPVGHRASLDLLCASSWVVRGRRLSGGKQAPRLSCRPGIRPLLPFKISSVNGREARRAVFG